MAVVAVGVGKVTVKVPADVLVLSEPKSRTATAAPVVTLYIKAHLAVKEAPVQTTGAKEIYDVFTLVSPVGTWVIVRGFPPAVYPAPVISLVVV